MQRSSTPIISAPIQGSPTILGSFRSCNFVHLTRVLQTLSEPIHSGPDDATQLVALYINSWPPSVAGGYLLWHRLTAASLCSGGGSEGFFWWSRWWLPSLPSQKAHDRAATLDTPRLQSLPRREGRRCRTIRLDTRRETLVHCPSSVSGPARITFFDSTFSSTINLYYMHVSLL